MENPLYMYISRVIEKSIKNAIKRNKSVLVLGSRQTGKTTLLSQIKADLSLSFADVEVRQEHEKNPALLKTMVEGLEVKARRRKLVFLDEIQKVPLLMDAVQDLIDRKVANFLLSGSSARKLRRGPNVNLLPGRVVSLRLDPLTLHEQGEVALHDLLIYGSLPGIHQTVSKKNKEDDLSSYVSTYLEEEIRAEAIVRNLGSFARFLELASSEAGKIVNFNKLSQAIGVADTTIHSYYAILEDCLIAERVEPISQSKTRKKLTKSCKYLFFDLGVRRKAAREGTQLPRETLGLLLEQWVGLELIRCARFATKSVQIKFWRDPSGPEVDWVIDVEGKWIPIEVKWTASPTLRDAKHLKTFLKEYKQASQGFVICQTKHRLKLSDQITAIPWQECDQLLLNLAKYTGPLNSKPSILYK